MKPYRGPISNHFDGWHFYNPVEMGPGSRPVDLLLWLANRKPGPWRPWIDSACGPPPPPRVFRGELRVTFVGHSTVLIQMDGINILCDPHWSERASPFTHIGPRRHRAPGLKFDDLPPIDLVASGFYRSTWGPLPADLERGGRRVRRDRVGLVAAGGYDCRN
jgi:hypothetical protein